MYPRWFIRKEGLVTTKYNPLLWKSRKNKITDCLIQPIIGCIRNPSKNQKTPSKRGLVCLGSLKFMAAKKGCAA